MAVGIRRSCRRDEGKDQTGTREAGHEKENCGTYVWHDEKGLQSRLSFAQGTKESEWRGRLHHAGLQHEAGSEHSWTGDHAVFFRDGLGGREKRKKKQTL